MDYNRTFTLTQLGDGPHITTKASPHQLLYVSVGSKGITGQIILQLLRMCSY